MTIVANAFEMVTTTSVCIRMLVVCTRMVRMLLLRYSYVTRMYSCGVLVMIVLI